MIPFISQALNIEDFMSDNQPNNSETKEERLRRTAKKLRRAVKKMSPSFPLDKQGKYDPDCVSVKFYDSEEYGPREEHLKERATGVFEDTSHFMSEKEKSACRISYDDAKGGFTRNGGIASTRYNTDIKETEHTSTFVADKNGDIYLFPYLQGFTHGSVLQDAPANMAGEIGINGAGKINYIGDSSGHYSKSS